MFHRSSRHERGLATGPGRKTDATDAHSVALVGIRMSGLRPVVSDEQLAVLRLLLERHRSMSENHRHDEWVAGDRRYLSEEYMAILSDSVGTGDHAAIESGE